MWTPSWHPADGWGEVDEVEPREAQPQEAQEAQAAEEAQPQEAEAADRKRPLATEGGSL